MNTFTLDVRCCAVLRARKVKRYGLFIRARMRFATSEKLCDNCLCVNEMRSHKGSSAKVLANNNATRKLDKCNQQCLSVSIQNVIAYLTLNVYAPMNLILI